MRWPVDPSSVGRPREVEPHRGRQSVRVLVVGAFVLASCGSSDGTGSADTPVSTAKTATAATAATATPESAVVPTVCANGESVAAGAFEIGTGAMRWAHCASAEAWRTALGATDDALYVKSATKDGTNTLTALHATTGTELWSRPIGWANAYVPDAAGPIAESGIVVTVVDDGNGGELVGLDALTGSERWRTTLPAESIQVGNVDPTAGTVTGGTPGSTFESVLLPLAVTDTMVVLSGYSGFGGLRGYDRATGVELWTNALSVQDDSGVGTGRSPAAVEGETVMIPAYGNLVAIDARTGTELWQAPGVNHPSTADGYGVGYSSGDVVSTFEVGTGTVVWTKPGQPSYGDFLAIGGGVVAVLDPERQVVAYDLASGEVRWRRSHEDPIAGEPQTATANGVFLLWEGELAVLSPTDGSTVWAAHAPLGSSLMNSLATNSDKLFVALNTLAWGD